MDKSGQQMQAEAEIEHFRRELGPFVVAAEDTRMPMLFTDATKPDNPIVFVNDACLDLTGYDREEVLGKSFHFLIAKGDDPDALSRCRAQFAEDAPAASEDCYRRRDGSEFWASTSVSPVRDDAGKLVQHFASLIDLTHYKQEQAHSHMLIDELNHRVKNTLATVQSIVWQVLRKESDPAIARASIEARLFALARSHDLLTAANWASAGLRDVVEAALEPFGALDGRSERIVIEGPNLRLPPKATLALGIAFHELATNAVKYGAFSNEAGSLLIKWAIEPRGSGDRLILHWSERDGPAVTPPAHKGFGSQVIERGLAYELGGKVDLAFDPAGIAVKIDIPAPRAPS